MTAKIYSYRRVSTLTQTEGVSLELQHDMEVLSKLSKEHDLPISDRIFTDEGKSAYKGEHLKQSTGELAAFLKAVKVNNIKAGSILCVYSLDRLSRQSIGFAKQTYLDLTNNGISIYSILDNYLYKAHDASHEILATIIFERANNESKTKSARTLGTALKRIKDHQNGVTTQDGYAYLISLGNAPWWISYREDKAVVPHETYWPIAQEVYRLMLSGMGNLKILEHLNENYEPPKTRTNAKRPERRTEWKFSTIANFHKQKSLFGQRTTNIKSQSYTLVNYYPPLMSEDEWYKLQAIKKMRSANGNRKRYSLITGLGIAKCLLCGAVVASGCCSDTKNTRFFCAGKRNLQNGCVGFSFTGKCLERILLHVLARDLFINNVIDTSDIDNQIELLKAQQQKLQQQRDRVFSVFMDEDSLDTPDIVRGKFKQIELELNQVNDNLTMLLNKRSQLIAQQSIFNENAQQFFDRTKQVNKQILDAVNEDNQDLRKSLRPKIQKLVKSIEIAGQKLAMYFRITLQNNEVIYAVHHRGRSNRNYTFKHVTTDKYLKQLMQQIPSKRPIFMLPIEE
ncbi:recombinase family protein [Thalassotalea litorea]|uniref:recombinase family protein n=1 Tax=Thalassotalea litorea TaxID=2020715 RepID=UPI0037370741